MCYALMYYHDDRYFKCNKPVVGPQPDDNSGVNALYP